MMSLKAQRICDILLIISLIVLVTLPDIVMSIFVELFHFLIEFIHISFEAIEAILDFLIENLFHTGLHNTQVIVFYLMLAGVIYGIYQFWLRLPIICASCYEHTMTIWIVYKTRWTIYWQTASLLSKVRLIAIAIAVGYLFFLLSF